MSRGGRVILLAILALAAVVLLRSAASAVYFTPRADLSGQIERSRTNLSNIRTAAQRHVDLKAELQAHADRSLGITREEVEAGLRSRLNRIAEEVAIASPSVSTAAPRSLSSPMERADLRDNPLREQVDFVELDATISGEGTLAQALELIDRIEAAPWLKRISSLAIDPKDGGERFGVTVRLTTIYLPTVPPDEESAEAVAFAEPYTGAGIRALQPLIERNPFRVPPAPAVAEAPGDPPPPAPEEQPPPYDYAQWTITMITASSRGREVWLLNSKNSESRTLAEGESLRDLHFIAATPDTAEFRLGEERFTVDVGSSLDQRTRIEK